MQNLDNRIRVYKISEIAREIKFLLEDTFGEVWVEGEVSNFQIPASGHFYFSLKDDTAVLAAAMFSRANKELKFKLENGMKAICFGKISAYGPSGKYQIIVEKIEPKGIGSLQLALEQLKERLEKEGLFAPEHKRPIPYLPLKVGVVTSPTGAAIRDILRVLDRRFSDVHIIISPAQVQGETAKDEIAQAINYLNSLNQTLAVKDRIEVMIVGRGGGSIEDLWAFNEEIVARAIYNSRIPVISAVGHERDQTIADLVADLRAATPSAAAELVIPKKQDLQERLNSLHQDLLRSFSGISLDFQQRTDDFLYRLNLAIGGILKLSFSEFDVVYKKLLLLNPAALVGQHQQKMIDLARQIYVRLGHIVRLKQAEFSGTVEKLSSLSPLNILGRGYSITFKMPGGSIIKEAGTVEKEDFIRTKLHKGEIISRVTEVN